MPEGVEFSHLNVPSDLSSKSGSSALPSSVRHLFETAFGQDFSQVRVHEGHAATLMGAEAFTRGTDIYISPGKYQPHTSAGKELLGHEMTHVVQQSAAAPGSRTVPSQPIVVTME